jgi:hypothetical protein
MGRRRFLNRAAMGFLLLLAGGALHSSPELPMDNDKNPNLKNAPQVLLQGLPTSLQLSNIQTLTEWTIASNLTGRLISGFSNGSLKPGIASSWAISEDKKSIEFEIDSNARFSDGRPIRSEDVVYTFRSLISSGGTTKFKFDHSVIDCINDEKQTCKAITILSPSRVRLTLKVPIIRLLPLLSLPDYGIISSKKSAAQGQWADWAVTSGDYSIDQENTDNRRIVLKRNSSIVSHGPNQILIMEAPSAKIDKSIIESHPNAVFRLPSLQSIETETHDTVESAPFWNRLVFINSQSPVVNAKRSKQLFRELERIINGKLGLIQSNLVPGYSLPFQAHSQPIKLDVRGSILISSFLYSDADLDSMIDTLKKRFPRMKTMIANTPREFIAAWNTGGFDYGLAQLSYGSQDPIIAIEFLFNIYLRDREKLSIKKEYARVLSARTADERSSAIQILLNTIHSRGLAQGLGFVNASFLIPKKFMFNPRFLLTGELTFSELRSN